MIQFLIISIIYQIDTIHKHQMFPTIFSSPPQANLQGEMDLFWVYRGIHAI